jgi:IS30 family transposase
MYEDRCQIYALSQRGASQEDIAGVLGVSQSMVSREMCRNRPLGCSPRGGGLPRQSRNSLAPVRWRRGR